jgi:hypothetical protein
LPLENWNSAGQAQQTSISPYFLKPQIIPLIFYFFWSAFERVPESELQRKKPRRQLISEFEIPKSYSNV